MDKDLRNALRLLIRSQHAHDYINSWGNLNVSLGL